MKRTSAKCTSTLGTLTRLRTSSSKPSILAMPKLSVSNLITTNCKKTSTHMINLSFDCHDFLYAIEGFARGSHLRQHVWERYVYASIPQMSDEDMDFLWYYLRRDVLPCYEVRIGDEIHHSCGYEDFMHCLAALHRGNRYDISFQSPSQKKPHKAVCYSFQGKFHPLFLDTEPGNVQPFGAYIPIEWVTFMANTPRKENRFVPFDHLSWWDDLKVYDNVK